MRPAAFRNALPIAAILIAFAASGAAQTPNATPDISGMWYLRGTSQNVLSKGDPLMTEWAQQTFKEAKPSFGPKAVTLDQTNDPVYKCYSPGVPRVYFHPMPVQIVQIPGQIIELFEYDHTVRHIATDQPKHPEDALPETWMGNSIGHWEGDTLVIDTIGYNGRSWLDRLGRPHSNQLHTVERLRRTDANTLQMDLTIEDPKAYKEPFTTTFNFRLEPKWRIQEHNCTDNDSFKEFEGGSAGK